MAVFTIGFMMIFIGIFLARKLKLIGSTLISKNDRKLIDKAKRALGFSLSSESTIDPAPVLPERNSHP